jgi:hypothetical protein
MGSRVETRRFQAQAMGKLNSTCTAPPRPPSSFSSPSGGGSSLSSLTRSRCRLYADVSRTSVPTRPLNPFPASLVRPRTLTLAPTTSLVLGLHSLPGGVTRLVTWTTIPAVSNWCFDCKITW